MKSTAGFVAAFLLLAPAAQADIVTWRASGTVTNQLPRPPEQGGVPFGAPLDVYLTFDTAAPDLDGDPRVGVYRNLLSVSIFVNGVPLDEVWSAVNVFAGDFIPDLTASSLTVLNEVPVGNEWTEGLEFQAVDDPTSPHNQVSIRMSDTAGAAGLGLNSDAIPDVPPDPLIFFSLRDITISGFFSPQEAYFYQATLTSLTAVPLPAAMWLLISALGALTAPFAKRKPPLLMA